MHNRDTRHQEQHQAPHAVRMPKPSTLSEKSGHLSPGNAPWIRDPKACEMVVLMLSIAYVVEKLVSANKC